MADDKQLGNYRFLIEINGINAGYFKSMSGLSSKQDMIEFRYGGDRTVRRKPGRVSFTNLVLEKGFTVGTELFDWRKDMVDGNKTKQDLSVVILDHDGSEKVRYNCYKCWPVSWEGPSLVAGAGETAVEKVELAVENVELG